MVSVGNKTKPITIHMYNQYMNRCDRVDQNLRYYSAQDRKSTKWWKKLYFWAVEIGQLNAYILYKISNNVEPQKPNLKFTFKGFK